MITMAVPGHGADSATASSLLLSRRWFLSKSQMSYHRSHRHASRRHASSALSPSHPSSPRDSDSSPCCSTALYMSATLPMRNKSQHTIPLTTGKQPPRYVLATPTPSQLAQQDGRSCTGRIHQPKKRCVGPVFVHHTPNGSGGTTTGEITSASTSSYTPKPSTQTMMTPPPSIIALAATATFLHDSAPASTYPPPHPALLHSCSLSIPCLRTGACQPRTTQQR